MTATLDYPTHASYAERAEAGAAYLDEHFDSWVLDIDREALDLNDCGRCVLGQEFGNYWTGLDRLGLTNNRVIEDLGFILPNEDDSPDAWDLLTAAWVEVIDARLDALAVTA